MKVKDSLLICHATVSFLIIDGSMLHVHSDASHERKKGAIMDLHLGGRCVVRSNAQLACLKDAGHIYPSPILQLPFIGLTLACCMAVCRCKYLHPANLGLLLTCFSHLIQNPAEGIAPERFTFHE